MTNEGLILDIDLSGIDETKANVVGYPAALSRELNVAMASSLSLLKQAVADRTPVDTDKLRGGITSETISVFPDLVGSVSSGDIPYAPVIEYGRKPGKFPPVDVIKKWVIRVLQVPDEEVDSVAFLVGRSIAKHGFAPKPKGAVGPTGAKMFREGLEASTPHINTLFEGAVARATAKANDQA